VVVDVSTVSIVMMDVSANVTKKSQRINAALVLKRARYSKSENKYL